MAFLRDLVFGFYFYGLLTIYEYLLVPIYQVTVLPIFSLIDRVLGWISWLYGFRATLMVQGIVLYWRGSIYFKRSSLWEKFVRAHPNLASTYLDPLFWTIDISLVIVAMVLVIVASVFGEKNIKKMFNVQGKIGVNFYRLGKTIGEVSMLRLMVFVGDHTTDKSVAEIEIASFFACFYISLVSLFKLCHIGNDLGFTDGIAAVILSIYTRYCKSETHRVTGIFISGCIILIKNVLVADCCAACSRAASQNTLPIYGGGGDDGRGGPIPRNHDDGDCLPQNRVSLAFDQDGNRVLPGDRIGGGGNGTGRGGSTVRRRGSGSRSVDFTSGSRSVDFTSVDVNDDESFHTARGSI